MNTGSDPEEGESLMPVLLGVMGVVVIGLIIIVVSVNKCDKERRKKENALDPLDDSPLTDPVELTIPGPHKNVIVLVNRANAERFRKRGPKVFPKFCRPDLGYSKALKYRCYTDDGDICVDMLFIYMMLFNEELPQTDALIDSWCGYYDSSADNNLLPVADFGNTEEVLNLNQAEVTGETDFSPLETDDRRYDDQPNPVDYSPEVEDRTPSGGADLGGGGYDYGSSSSDSGGGSSDCGGGGGGCGD